MIRWLAAVLAAALAFALGVALGVQRRVVAEPTIIPDPMHHEHVIDEHAIDGIVEPAFRRWTHSHMVVRPTRHPLDWVAAHGRVNPWP